MEDRCVQFHTDAQKPWDAIKSKKEIDRLRKFLYKNQEHRFTDKEQSQLFQAVSCHVSSCASQQQAAVAPAEEDGDNPALALVEDALKMPFTVFTTSQKKTMLKWLEKLKPSGPGKQDTSTGAGRSTWSVTNVEDDTVSLMNNDGDELEISITPQTCSAALIQELRQQYDAGEAVEVVLDAEKHIITNVKIAG